MIDFKALAGKGERALKAVQKGFDAYVKDAIEQSVSDGGEYAPTELAELRIKKCRTNECGKYEKGMILPFVNGEKCKGCGCDLNIKKLFLKHRDLVTKKIVETKCPVKAWEQIDNDYLK